MAYPENWRGKYSDYVQQPELNEKSLDTWDSSHF